MKRYTFAPLLLFFLFVGCAERTATPPVNIADNGEFVNDTASVLSVPIKADINARLKVLEKKDGTQVKVLTVLTTGDEDIFMFSQRTAVAWKLGQKGTNNGVLVVLAVNDRKVRVQVGYGMEEKLTDQFCGSVSRDAAKSYFKKKDYEGGINLIVTNILRKL